MNNALPHKAYISADLQVRLFAIASELGAAALPEEFIASATRTALEYEGIADLLVIWSEENDLKERKEIIADIQELLDDCFQQGKFEYPYVKFNDLEKISEDIRAFKDSLLTIVNEKSSINELSKLTGIPQPSLSRFFSTTAMPRRSTLLKIAKALKLDSVKIATRWNV